MSQLDVCDNSEYSEQCAIYRLQKLEAEYYELFEAPEATCEDEELKKEMQKEIKKLSDEIQKSLTNN